MADSVWSCPSVSRATRATALSLCAPRMISTPLYSTWQVSLSQRHFGMGGTTHSSTSHITGTGNLEEHSPESQWQQPTQIGRVQEVQPALHPSKPPKQKIIECLKDQQGLTWTLVGMGHPQLLCATGLQVQIHNSRQPLQTS